MTNCLNCGEALRPHNKFCPECGQKIETARLSFRKLGHDFLLTFIKVEKGLFNLLKGLALRPGETAKEYIGGKRKTYLNPLTFTGACIAIMLLIMNIFHPYTFASEPDPAILARMPDERLMNLYTAWIQRIGEFQRFGIRHMGTLSILISPWFAFFLWLFFKRRGWNMAEISVAYILFAAFSNLVNSLWVSPLLSLTKSTGFYYPILYTSIFLQTIYLAWGLKVFFNFREASGYWKVLGVLLLAGSIGLILFFSVFFIYVFRGEYGEVFKYL
jgi:hypothetical protein